MPYHAQITLDIYPDVMEETSFPTGYFNSNGVFVPTSNIGRTLRLMARVLDASNDEVILDSQADASICEPLSGDPFYVYIKIPSSLTALLPLGQHPFSIVDITDAGTDGEVLIAIGVINVIRQATY